MSKFFLILTAGLALLVLVVLLGCATAAQATPTPAIPCIGAPVGWTKIGAAPLLVGEEVYGNQVSLSLSKKNGVGIVIWISGKQNDELRPRQGLSDLEIKIIIGGIPIRWTYAVYVCGGDVWIDIHDTPTPAAPLPKGPVG